MDTKKCEDEALLLLDHFYRKIFKIDLAADRYEILKSDTPPTDRTPVRPTPALQAASVSQATHVAHTTHISYASKITDYFRDAMASGEIHPGDRDSYAAFTDIQNLRSFFQSGKP